MPNTNEFPPQDNIENPEHLIQEETTAQEIDPILSKEAIEAREAHDQSAIEALKEDLSKTPEEKIATEENFPDGKPVWEKKPVEEAPKAQKKSWWKKALVTVGFMAAGAAATAKGADKNPADSLENGKNKIEKIGTSKENKEAVSAQLRTDWNKYVDWLQSKGLKGDPSLDHNGLGFKMIEEYKKENPATTVSKETVENIQQEFAKYREWSLNEIKEGRAAFAQGANEKNFLSSLSIIDGIPGQRTTSFKFPASYLYHFTNNKLEQVENKGFATTATLTASDLAKNK